MRASTPSRYFERVPERAGQKARQAAGLACLALAPRRGQRDRSARRRQVRQLYNTSTVAKLEHGSLKPVCSNRTSADCRFRSARRGRSAGLWLSATYRAPILGLVPLTAGARVPLSMAMICSVHRHNAYRAGPAERPEADSRCPRQVHTDDTAYRMRLRRQAYKEMDMGSRTVNPSRP